MMRRVICFLLVLVMCMSMTVTASANAPSIEKPVVNGNPPTGDIIMKWVVIMILALLALCVMYVLYRKMFKK